MICKVCGFRMLEKLYLSQIITDLTANNGFSRWRKYISPDGKRQDAAHQYLHPLLQDGRHPNLHVLVETEVLRIIFDANKRASGVEYVPSWSSLNPPTIKFARATKMVIICSGALGTPSILERSGIGNPSLLEKLGIPVISGLPGVGENYQDHHLIQSVYKLQFEAEQANNGHSGDIHLPETKIQRSLSGWNAIDLTSKLRPTVTEIKELGPKFQAVWDKEFESAPERPLVIMGVISRYIGTEFRLPL
jgi:alcohol oxidase